MKTAEIASKFISSQEEGIRSGMYSCGGHSLNIKELIKDVVEYTIDELESSLKAKEDTITELKEFIKWYSGMEQEKIDSAYQRFLKEGKAKISPCPHEALCVYGCLGNC